MELLHIGRWEIRNHYLMGTFDIEHVVRPWAKFGLSCVVFALNLDKASSIRRPICIAIASFSVYAPAFEIVCYFSWPPNEYQSPP